MMTQQGSDQASFQALLESHFQASGSDDSLHKVKAKAWDHFLEMGLPTKKTEVYRYIKLRQLFSQSLARSVVTHVDASQIASHIYPECRESVLVFVNGHFNAALSNTAKIPSKIV